MVKQSKKILKKNKKKSKKTMKSKKIILNLFMN